MNTDGRRARRKILLLASGFEYSVKRSRNLGDVAQQLGSVARIKQWLNHPEILAVANSLNDRSLIEGLVLSHRFVEYLSKPRKNGILARLLPVKLIALVRAAIFLANARRAAAGMPVIGLNRKGQEALQELREADGLVVSGAGAFNDHFAGGSIAIIWGVIMRSVAALGKPVVLSGQQIGPLDCLLPRAISRWSLQVATTVGVRDPVSIPVAVSLGIDKSRLVLTGDDAWELEGGDHEGAINILKRYGVTGGFVAGQVRLDPATDITVDDSRRLAEIFDGISETLRLPVVFVRMYYARTADDVTSAEAVRSLMRSPSIVIEDELSPSLTKSLIGAADVAIGISYHFCIFAVSSGTPTVGLFRSPYMKHKLEGISQMWPGYMVAVGLDSGSALQETGAGVAGMKRVSVAGTPRQVMQSPYEISNDKPISILASILDQSGGKTAVHQ